MFGKRARSFHNHEKTERVVKGQKEVVNDRDDNRIREWNVFEVYGESTEAGKSLQRVKLRKRTD